MSLPTTDYNSVDLTEDEDSREEEYFANRGVNIVAFSHVNTSAPPPLSLIQKLPPLTPIQKLKSFQENPLPAGHTARIPKLKKIITKDQPFVYSKPPEKDSTPLNIQSPMEVVYIESEPNESSLVQNDIKPKSSPFRDTNSTTRENTFSSMNRPPGKLVVIKKNNKLYRIVIPHNVMPSVNQSAGPVLINIPEVGPLVITIDPHVKNQPKPNECNQLKPFSLNFDTIYEKVNMNMKSNIKDSKPKSNRKPTCKSKIKVNNMQDNKCCWMPKLLSVTDTKGFSKFEANTAKACAGEINLCINKKYGILQRHIKSFEIFQKEALKRNNIKPVRLTKILGNRKYKNYLKSDEKSLLVTEQNNDYIKKKDSNMSLDTCNNQPSYFDDLLLTKKVVILNNGSTEEEEEENKMNCTRTRRSRKKKVKHSWVAKGKQELKKMNNNANCELKNMKACFVKMIRDKDIDVLSLKYSQNDSPNTRVNKRTSKTAVETESSELHGIYKTNHSKYLKDTTLSLLEKLIDSEDKLVKEMYFMKPTLVLNETNFKMVQYKDEFSKSNIVFPVNEDRGFAKSVLTNFDFITAVNSGYIKLVDSDLLCEFLVGDLVPKKPPFMK